MKRWMVLALGAALLLGSSFTASAAKKPSVTSGMEVIESKLPDNDDLHPEAGDIRIFENQILAEEAAKSGQPADILYYWEWKTGTVREYYPDVPDDVFADIMKVNAGEMGVEELSDQFAGYGLLAQIGDLHMRRYNDGSFHHGYVYGKETGSLTNLFPFTVLEASWQVDNITADMDIRIIHYSNTRSGWEIIEPLELNVTDKAITALFDDLSPIGVIYRLDSVPGGSHSGGNSSSGQLSEPQVNDGTSTMYTSPKTGQGYGAEALLFLGCLSLLAAAYLGMKVRKCRN